MNSLNNDITVKVVNEPELKAGSVHSLEENLSILKELRLSGMAQALSDSKQDSSFLELGFNDQLYELLKVEITKRRNSCYQRRLKKCELTSSATQEVISERKKSYHLTQSHIDYLMSGQWHKEGELIIITGKCGCGKTDLASAIVDASCRKGLKCLCVDYSLMITELASALFSSDHKAYENAKKQYYSHDVLFIDDICIGEQRNGESFVFKDLVQKCRENNRCGLILASQLSPVNWLHHMGGSKEAADAVMDRILHNYQLIQLDGQSKRSEKPKLKNEEVQ